MKGTRMAMLLPLVVCACGGDANTGEQPAAAASVADAEVDAIKQATERFKDVNVALAEGYMEDPHKLCVDATIYGAPVETGAMGIHYFRPDLLGIAMPPGGGPPPEGVRVSGTDSNIDFSQPEVLVYEPTADGGRELVAIEYLVFKAAWDAAGNSGPPMFRGTAFLPMADDPATPADEAHAFEPHYELHWWIYRDNPSGEFAEFNPNVRCPRAPAGT
jgi:hypothetical protein